ncbi:ATP-binding SpoIIE family protein phosphatase [Methylophilus flavus]|uniref:ATP-binding SpoIIE family protein phosphatase n=1 Tax=Methylophilus flavus TaxID=640084 RepID=A0ABW3PF06_9PROT
MMVLGTQSCHNVGELSEVSSARRAGVEMSRKLGFDDVRSGELAIIITEAATNIGKHAKSGQIYLRAISEGDKHGIEVLAVDSGPGMRDIEINFIDGNSSTGTSGTGLGAIKRLAHFMDIYSEHDKGTVLLMILWADPEIISENFWEIGNMCLPIPSETVCGDSWIAVGSENGLSVLVADGLGHGQGAAEASLLAVKALQDDPALFPARVMQNSHLLMRGSRGAAVAVARIDAIANELRYCGIGNIAGCICSQKSRQHLISHNGIVGNNMRKTQEFLHKWTDDSIVIMHSDGIGTKWSIEHYPELENRHSSVIAAVLHRDFTRGRDDATIVVFKRILN